METIKELLYKSEEIMSKLYHSHQGNLQKNLERDYFDMFEKIERLKEIDNRTIKKRKWQGIY